jgi:hypothetical protein
LYVNNLGLGTHHILAAYGGDGVYLPSSTPTALLATVTKLTPTVTVIEYGPAPTGLGQLATFYMTVVPPAGNSVLTPTGYMQFIVNGVAQPVQPLNSYGMAGLYTTALASGINQIFAAYGGDSNYNASGTPTPLNALVLDPNPATHLVAQPVGPISINTPFNLSVSAYDASNNVATSFSAQAILTVTTAPAGGNLSGTLTSTFVNGSDAFSHLSATKAGLYIVEISAGGLTTAITITITSV